MTVGIVLNGVLTWGWLELIKFVAEVTRKIRLHLNVYPSRPKTIQCALKTAPVVEASELTEEIFMREYIRKRIPVIVKGAVKDWPAMSKWTPQFFADNFGDCPTTLQDNLFHVISRGTVRDTIDAMIAYDKEADSKPVSATERPPYMRYFVARGSWNQLLRLCGLFSWIKGTYFTHECFLRLKQDWHLPAFMPKKGYSLPFSVFGCQGPTERFFYDFGVYISPKRAVTRLHFDGTRTHAVLCQVHGKKSGVLFPPEMVPWFLNAVSSSIPENEPDYAHYPEEWKRMLPMQPLHFTLEEGDMAFIPKVWLHEVYTEQLSVTLTYNFNCGVYERLEGLLEFLWYGWINYFVLRP